MVARRSAAVALAMLLLALSACTAAPASPEDSPPQATTASSRPPLPDEPTAAQQAVASDLQAEGHTEAEALFIALTDAEVESLGEFSERIRYLLPTGNTADISVTVVPDQTGEAGTDAVTLASSATGGAFSFDLSYFVPYEDMPPDVQDELRNGAATTDTRLAVLGMAPPAGPIADGSSGVDVIVKGVVDEFQNDKASEFIEFLDKQLGMPGKLDTLYKHVEAGLSVKDALAMKTLFEALQRQIDQLEDCARNPTNPITRRAYRDDPGYLPRILDQIAQVREEVKANTAVMFIAKLNQTAAGFLSKSVKWLAYVVGPLTSWSKATLDELNAKLIADLQKNITECEKVAVEFTVADIPYPAWADDDATLDVSGHVVGCPQDDGTWEFTGSYTLTTDWGAPNYQGIGGPEPPETDTLVDGIGNQSAASITLALGATDELTTVTITDALGNPSGVFTWYDRFGDKVGDFPLEVTKVDLDCPVEEPAP